MARIVDPAFPERLRVAIAASGASYRALAARTFYSRGYLHDLASRAEDTHGGGRAPHRRGAGLARRVGRHGVRGRLRRRRAGPAGGRQ